MPYATALQMDPISSLNPLTDTTLLLGIEAQRRGHQLFCYTPADLFFRESQVMAHTTPVRLYEDATHWFEAGAPMALCLHEMDVILLRQDPPFDISYITTTYLLERLKGKTLVVNDPASVRNFPEKLFPLDFPEFIPPTLISRDKEDIRTFHREYQDIVLKPLYGHGGQAVFRIKPEGDNLGALLDILLRDSQEPIIAQKFLSEVTTGERRMLVIDGEIKGLLGRLPAEGEFRANLCLGGTAALAELTPRQREIGERVGAVLREQGLLLAGLDFIGDYLTEINITSPTGMRQTNALYGLNLERDFWDAVEKRL